MAPRITPQRPHLRPPHPKPSRPAWARQLWWQVGPAALLGLLLWLAHAWLVMVYAQFYAQLGLSAAEANVSDSEVFAPAVREFLAVTVAALLLMPVIAVFMVVNRYAVDGGRRSWFIAAVYLPAPVSVSIAVLAEHSTVGSVVAGTLDVLFASVAAGALLNETAPTLMVFAACGAGMLDVVVVSGLYVTLHGTSLAIGVLASDVMIGAALLVLAKRLPADSKLRGPLRLPPMTSLTARQRLMILMVVVTVALLVPVEQLYRLSGEAMVAADQVLADGYVHTATTDLDLFVRPVTVRLLTTADPAQLCSATQPVAISQINRGGPDAVVIVRPLQPHTFTPTGPERTRVQRLPASLYAVVQYPDLYRHAAEHDTTYTSTHTSERQQAPWTVPACADPFDRSTWP